MDAFNFDALSDKAKIMYERFMEKVNKKGSPRIHPESLPNASGCWTHIASVSSGGYGQLWIFNSAWLVHRLSWWLHNSCPEPPHDFWDAKKFVVSHLCDNKECCNPEHLSLDTRRQNAIDGVSRCKAKKPIKEPIRNSEPCFECVKNHKSCDGGVPCNRCKNMAIECVKKMWKATAATFKVGECSGENNAACKLTDARLLEFYKKATSPLAYGGLKKLSEEYQISYTFAQKIKGGSYPRLKELLTPPT